MKSQKAKELIEKYAVSNSRDAAPSMMKGRAVECVEIAEQEAEERMREKAQIEAVERKQNKYKLIGQMVRVPGHTLYKFNTVTRTASRAEVEVSAYSWLNPKNMKVEIDRKSRVKVEKDCYYEQALNIKNFIKRLRRRGIVGMDEVVKLER